MNPFTTLLTLFLFLGTVSLATGQGMSKPDPNDARECENYKAEKKKNKQASKKYPGLEDHFETHMPGVGADLPCIPEYGSKTEENRQKNKRKGKPQVQYERLSDDGPQVPTTTNSPEAAQWEQRMKEKYR